MTASVDRETGLAGEALVDDADLAAADPVMQQAALEALAARFVEAQTDLSRVVVGQSNVVELALITILCGGHGLLVGLPGLAKTRLVKALGTVLGLSSQRVQFTPDLMPSDILGSEILDVASDGSRSFRFVNGPVFAQLLMADEINRASPKTQSALLEAMQEHQVTVAGVHHVLPVPFHVLATQNPIEQEGTYPLPEAQLDRFLFQIDVDYPDEDAERSVLLMTTGAKDVAPGSILAASDVLAAQQLIRHLPVPNHIVDAALRTVRAARPGAGQPALDWGPGPRGGQALIMGARARAFLRGRFTPLIEDLDAVLAPALTHRIAVSYAAQARGTSVAGIIASLREQLAD